MVKLWPVRVKVRSGRESRFSHSIVYWPLKDFLAPISLLLRRPCRQHHNPHEDGRHWTYRSSASVEGRAMSEVPVSRMTPVLSSSALSLPKVMASRSTSQ